MAETRPPPAGGGEPDPSMDDILASIRRILSEDEQANLAQAAQAPRLVEPPAGVPPAGDDVLNLDDTMLVAEPTRPPSPPAPPQPGPGPGPAHYKPEAEREDRGAMSDVEPQPAGAFVGEPRPSGLVAPEAEAAAAHAMGSLRRTIEARANAALGPAATMARGMGPTLEDVVRDELRPMLKAWLDANLPAMVERLVAVEIERLVARSAS